MDKRYQVGWVWGRGGRLFEEVMGLGKREIGLAGLGMGGMSMRVNARMYVHMHTPIRTSCLCPMASARACVPFLSPFGRSSLLEKVVGARKKKGLAFVCEFVRVCK